MHRDLYWRTAISVALVVLNASLAAAQINPAGFQDPLGANRAGTGNPPNTTVGPIGGSTLLPGTPAYQRDVETNSALRQEVRRPFGGAMYPGGRMNRPQADEGSGRTMNLSEHQSTDTEHVAGHKSGPAEGKLAGDWRYKYYQGRHWYWMPNRTWQVWSGTEWEAHRPGMFLKPIFGAGTQPRRYVPIPAGYDGRGFGAPTEPPASVELAAKSDKRGAADGAADSANSAKSSRTSQP